MNNKLTIVTFIASLSLVSAAHAVEHKVDWNANCKAEMEKFKCDPNAEDEVIYQCLLRHDVDLSKKCDNEAHSKYEKLTGKAK